MKLELEQEEEAALFASDLLRMYAKYSENQNWKTEIMDISQTDHNGVKEVVLNVSGKNVFGNLKFESGNIESKSSANGIKRKSSYISSYRHSSS